MGLTSSNFNFIDVNAATIKEGYLMKQSKHCKQYRKRWMSLKETLIFISRKKPFDKQSTEEFDLLKYYEIREISSTKFQIISAKLNSERTFKAETNSEMLEWIKTLKKIIADARDAAEAYEEARIAKQKKRVRARRTSKKTKRRKSRSDDYHSNVLRDDYCSSSNEHHSGDAHNGHDSKHDVADKDVGEVRGGG
eukprot:UN11494